MFFCFWLLCPTLHVGFAHVVCSFRYSRSRPPNIPVNEPGTIYLPIVLPRTGAASRGGDYEQAALRILLFIIWCTSHVCTHNLSQSLRVKPLGHDVCILLIFLQTVFAERLYRF